MSNHIHIQRKINPEHAPHSKLPSSPSDISFGGLPNSALADMLDGNSAPDIGTQNTSMAYKLMMFQNQLPAAEEEADRLSAGVRSQSPEELKQEMGQRLGADFSNVTFHTDSASANKAEAMGAHAWTQGSDIYMGAGGFDPSVAAHELVHTVQQGAVNGSVSESAPNGTVQMKGKGFFSWLFGKKDKKPENPLDRLSDQTRALVMHGREAMPNVFDVNDPAGNNEEDEFMLDDDTDPNLEAHLASNEAKSSLYDLAGSSLFNSLNELDKTKKIHKADREAIRADLVKGFMRYTMENRQDLNVGQQAAIALSSQNALDIWKNRKSGKKGKAAAINNLNATVKEMMGNFDRQDFIQKLEDGREISKTAAPVPKEEAPKKRGFFSRLFGRKEKKPIVSDQMIADLPYMLQSSVNQASSPLPSMDAVEKARRKVVGWDSPLLVPKILTINDISEEERYVPENGEESLDDMDDKQNDAPDSYDSDIEVLLGKLQMLNSMKKVGTKKINSKQKDYLSEKIISGSLRGIMERKYALGAQQQASLKLASREIQTSWKSHLKNLKKKKKNSNQTNPADDMKTSILKMIGIYDEQKRRLAKTL